MLDYFSPKWYYSLWYGQRRDVKFILGLRRQLNSYRQTPYIFKYTTSFLLVDNYLKNYKNENVRERQVVYFKKGGFHIQKKDKVLFVTKIII